MNYPCPRLPTFITSWCVPILSTLMQACSPNLAADADCLEQIQRLAMRLVKGFRRLSYEERLRRLGLHCSCRRRHRGDLKVVLKMFSGGLDLDPSLFFIPPAWPGFNVLQCHGWGRRRKSPFSTRIVKYWNWLPTPIATAPSVNSFKRQLDSAWEELIAEVP